MVIRIIKLLTLSLLLASPVLARDISSTEKQALADLVTRYEAAYVERNYSVLGAALPPRVLKR